MAQMSDFYERVPKKILHTECIEDFYMEKEFEEQEQELAFKEGNKYLFVLGEGETSDEGKLIYFTYSEKRNAIHFMNIDLLREHFKVI